LDALVLVHSAYLRLIGPGRDAGRTLPPLAPGQPGIEPRSGTNLGRDAAVKGRRL